MQKSGDPSNNFDDARAASARTGKPEIGDADVVQKTTWVTGSGTDPDAPTERRGTARVKPGGGMNVGLWVVIAIALVLALVYGAGLFG